VVLPAGRPCGAVEVNVGRRRLLVGVLYVGLGGQPTGFGRLLEPGRGFAAARGRENIIALVAIAGHLGTLLRAPPARGAGFGGATPA
ncbi:MAG TPA: hypothetical protein VIL95_02080, partial [Bacillota bacterium]